MNPAVGRGEPPPGGLAVASVALDAQTVTVHWRDGHQSVYPARHLRVNCTCAECVEEWTNRRLLDPTTVAHDIRAEDYLMVGRYAIEFLWSDGHYTGIYSLENLRRLCPCEECKASRA